MNTLQGVQQRWSVLLLKDVAADFALEPIGSGFFKGSLETGLEPWLQYYLEPSTATAEGLKVGFSRLIGIWPFPDNYIARVGGKVKKVIVAEMNMGKVVREVQRCLGVRPLVHRRLPRASRDPDFA